MSVLRHRAPRRTTSRRALAATIVLVAGCATPLPAPPDSRVPDPAEPPAAMAGMSPTPGSVGTSTGRPSRRAAAPTVPGSPASGESDARARPSGPESAALTFAGALQLALERSPRLAAAASAVQARRGRAVQAGLLPNPTLQGQIEDFAGTGSLSGFDASETTLLLAQPIETAGKRPKRRSAARLGIDVARWDYQTTRLEVTASVRRAFVEVLAAQQRVALCEGLVELARGSVESVDRLVAAGAAPAIDRTRSQLEVSTARVELSLARRALESARADLAATWAAPRPRFEHAEGDLQAVEPPPSPEATRARLARHPRRLRWEREIERRNAIVELEQSRRFPDVTARAGVRRAAAVDETAFVAGLSIPIPIFDRGQGSRTAARAELLRARHARTEADASLAVALQRAHQELAARFEEITALRGTILPRARETFEGVRDGYARGLFRNLEVLDAQRRLFRLRLRLTDSLRRYHLARAEIARLTATQNTVPDRSHRPREVSAR